MVEKDELISSHQYPEGDFNHERKVTVGAVRKVRAIQARAESLGWTESDLLTTRGTMACPYGNRYGLVSFVYSGDIGEITPDRIEIIHRLPNRTYQTHFTRPSMYRSLTPAEIESRAERQALTEFGS